MNFSLKKSKEFPKLFSVLSDQFFMSITTLLISVVLARVFDKTDYADLVLLFSVTLFVLGFQSALISRPYAINLNDVGELEQDSFYNSNVLFKLCFTIAIILLFPIVFFLFFKKDYNILKLVLFLFYIVSHTTFYFVRETMLSERKTKQNLYYGLTCSLSLLTVLVVIFFLKIKKIEFFLISFSLIYFLVSSVYFILNSKRLALKIKALQNDFKKNWEVGKWLVGANVLFHFSSEIYPWLLLYLSTKDNIAILGVLLSVANIINPLLTAISSYLLPLFVKNNKNYINLSRAVKKWSLLFSLMSILLIIIGCFFGQSIISMLFGEKYNNLGILIVFPFVVQAINIFFQPYKIALNAIKRTDVNFWILIPRSVLAICLGYFFITKYGLIGVFYTKIVENLLYQLVYYILYVRIVKRNKKAIDIC
ncbi:lipopolysaccharide biosynthesis protein [Aquimarina agarilytica]|uniref:lipopolysaccharide biosynthesis protein n=1 Tax=Aquimarina agarilytica TaxID=1087449 RepID=UPI0002883978|nr:polysaccharide biosynthesis protein [Aquimarina agarilytica]